MIKLTLDEIVESRKRRATKIQNIAKEYNNTVVCLTLNVPGKIRVFELLEHAKQACENAYAQYSNFYVGACALYDSGNYYLGCNVENASYGLTLCAERNAISNAVANGEKGKLIKVAIFSKNRTHKNKLLLYYCLCLWYDK